MKKPRSLYVWIGIATLVAVIVGIAWPSSPGEKPSVTLSDGTIITVEKAEVFSTWPERFREWLGENSKLNRFLNDKLGWQQGWRVSQAVRYHTDYFKKNHAVLLKISVNKLDRFKRMDGDPLLWLTVPDSNAYQFVLSVSDGEKETGDYIIQHFDEDGVCEALFGTDSGKPLERVQIFLHTMKGGEAVNIPLKKEPNKDKKAVAYSLNPKDCKSLPMEQEVASASQMQARLDVLPVDFQENNGVRVLENDKDVTVETAMWRWVAPPDDIETWKTIGTVSVQLTLARKSPKNEKLELPPFKFSEEGQSREWDSASLNPAFPQARLYCVSKGVYYFSGNPEKEGMTLKIAAKSKQEKQDEFRAILEAAKSKKRKSDFSVTCNHAYDKLFWQDEAGNFHSMIKVNYPHLFLMLNQAWPERGPLMFRTVCWQKGVDFPARVDPVPWRGWMEMCFGENKFEKLYQFTIGESFYGWAFFRVIVNESEREAWAAHWLAEKAKREKEEQEKKAQNAKAE